MQLLTHLFFNTNEHVSLLGAEMLPAFFALSRVAHKRAYKTIALSLVSSPRARDEV